MDVSASVRSYPLQDDRDFKDAVSIFWTSSRAYSIVRTFIVVIIIHSRFCSCKFLMYPVST
jgi:hypothetical protein